MSGRVVDVDHGYKKLRASLKLLKGSYTKVGVQAGAQRDDAEGVTDMVTVAVANELGVRNDAGGWRIPPRSFIGAAYDLHKDELHRDLATQKDEILAGRRDAKAALDAVGLKHAAQVVAVIHSHPPPPNAPSTVERKQSTGTLVDSGQLAQSIRHVTVVGRG